MLQELQPAYRIWNIIKVNLLDRPNVYTILRHVIYKNLRDLSARQNPALFFLTRGYAKRRNGFLLGLRYANVSLAHSGVESS